MMEPTPKGHYLDNLESMLMFHQRKGPHRPARLAVARLYEVLGHINIEELSTSNVLVYWNKEEPVPERARKYYHKESPTAAFYRGIRYLIKAARSYGAAGQRDEAGNVLERTALFLQRATKKNFFDEEVLRGVAFELLGDVSCLQGDANQAKQYYKEAEDVYKEVFSGDESQEVAWQVQEELDALGAIFEPLDAESYSDIRLLRHTERLRIKEGCSPQSKTA